MILFYIDPGTGSMLFSILIGLATAIYFIGRAAFMKIKALLSGGKAVVAKNHLPLVIYSEGTRYWGTFEPIIKALEERAQPTVFYTSSEDDPIFEKDFTYITSEYIGEGNKAFARLNFLDADVCLMTTPGLGVYQLKRSKGVRHYSHVLHAATDATTYRLFGLDYFDSVLLTGEYQKKHLRVLEKQRNLPAKELVVVGCPYLDTLQSDLEKYANEPKDIFTVLVAPSWGPSGILSKYGELLLDSLVATNHSIIVRPHPQSWQVEKERLIYLQDRYGKNSNLEWDDAADNLRSLVRSDIMISDFSGVMFDYTFLLNRPFLYVFEDFDARPYDWYDIDEEPWMFTILPEIGRKLHEDQFQNISNILQEMVDASSRPEFVKQTAWQHQGESGAQVADFLVSKL